ncbi:MAG: hypothetical protein ABI637_08795 [Gemmatimonadota bacterium]
MRERETIGGGMGGSDGNASEIGREQRVLPEDAIGDVPIERRHHHNESYAGPERRIADR